MKTINFKKTAMIISAIAFFGLTNVVANNISTEEIRESIVEKVTYPDFAKEESIQGNVNVTFGFNEDGSLIIYSVVSDQTELADYVKKTISNFKFADNNIDRDKTYRIVIAFKLI
ncbi:MAG: energy transducer TonB [Bacteroidales bacterium]|nr:energy transducer TonB [Bacteroidales bacterium]